MAGDRSGNKVRGRPPKPITPEKSALSLLGRALRGVREAAGLSLAEFSAWSGYSSPHLSRVEHGKATPSPELVQTYEAHFDTDGVLRSIYRTVLDEQETARLTRRGASAPVATTYVTRSARTQPGDRSEFIADLTIPDGMVVRPGAKFVKSWRIRNAGLVPWRARLLERIGQAAAPH
jgi:transcriptional regulator with XRE-family HTH domain